MSYIIALISIYAVIKYAKWVTNQPLTFSENLSEQSEELLSELTDLRLLQAETLAQIEDIREGKTVKTTVKRQYGTETTISSAALLIALEHEEEQLSIAVANKAIEFSKSMLRSGNRGEQK